MDTEQNNRAHQQAPNSKQIKDVDQYSIHSLSSRPTHATNTKQREQINNAAQIRQGSFNMGST